MGFDPKRWIRVMSLILFLQVQQVFLYRKNDTKWGYGIYVWKDGSKYEGDFVDGIRHGHGFYSYSKYDKYKRDYYIGDWREGLKSGKYIR